MSKLVVLLALLPQLASGWFAGGMPFSAAVGPVGGDAVETRVAAWLVAEPGVEALSSAGGSTLLAARSTSDATRPRLRAESSPADAVVEAAAVAAASRRRLELEALQNPILPLLGHRCRGRGS